MRSSSSAASSSRPRRSAARRRADPPGEWASPGRRAAASPPEPSRGPSRRRWPPASAPPSVTPVALLTPWVAVVVVADALPEAGLVLVAEPQAPHPLGALPEIQVRDQQPRRTAVFGLEILALETERHPGLAVQQVLQRQVGRVPTIAEGNGELGGRVDALQQRVQRHPLPAGAELGPLGHAVDVHRDLLGRQRPKLLPRPSGRHGTGIVDDPEVPILQRRVRCRAGAQHGEVVDEVLARWHQTGAGLAPPTLEPTAHNRHTTTSRTTTHRNLRPTATTNNGTRPANTGGAETAGPEARANRSRLPSQRLRRREVEPWDISALGAFGAGPLARGCACRRSLLARSRLVMNARSLRSFRGTSPVRGRRLRCPAGPAGESASPTRPGDGVRTGSGAGMTSTALTCGWKALGLLILEPRGLADGRPPRPAAPRAAPEPSSPSHRMESLVRLLVVDRRCDLCAIIRRFDSGVLRQLTRNRGVIGRTVAGAVSGGVSARRDGPRGDGDYSCGDPYRAISCRVRAGAWQPSCGSSLWSSSSLESSNSSRGRCSWASSSSCSGSWWDPAESRSSPPARAWA